MQMRYLTTSLLTLSVLCTLTTTAQADYTSRVESLNPLAYWRLGEAGGTTAVDAANAYDGVYHNVRLGQSGAIEGNPDTSMCNYPGYMEVPHADAFLLDNGSFAFWFQDINSIHNTGLFSKDSSGYDTGGHVTALTKSNGSVQVRLQSTTDSHWVGTDPFIELDQWYHLAFTFGSNGMKLYLDGDLVDSNSYTGGLGSTSGGVGNFEPIVLGANSWRSGNLSATPLSGFFSGRLDEFVIFDYQLSEEQVEVVSSQVPEPTSLALVGFAAIATLRRRR